MRKLLKLLALIFLLMIVNSACHKSSNFSDEIKDETSTETDNELENKDFPFVYYEDDELENKDFPSINYEHLNTRKDKVIIKTRSNAEAKELSKQAIFLSERPAYDVGIWVIATIDSSKTNLNDLLKVHGVIDATYGLEYENVLHYPSDQIFVQLKEELSPIDVLGDIGLEINSKSIELINPYDKIYLITLDLKLDDILNTCRYIAETGMCEFAEPSFFREMKNNALIQTIKN